MNRAERLTTEFVEFIPETLRSGVLYVSNEHHTASHLCCCGCGQRVVTPLKPGGWRHTTRHGHSTLYPSIGNWSLPCRSHYWIRDGAVIWAGAWTDEEIDEGRMNDRAARKRQFEAPPTVWQRIQSFFGNWFK